MGTIPKVIPPRSRVRLVKADRQSPTWRKDVGRRFRVGYYSRKDGLDCIWLVNEDGEYEQTTDRESLLKYFEIERLSHELLRRGKKTARQISPKWILAQGTLPISRQTRQCGVFYW